MASKEVVDDFEAEGMLMLTSIGERVRAERDQLERDFPKLQKFQGKPIKLDIGGFIFKTSLETLRKDTDSMLAIMFSGRSVRERTRGRVLLHRSRSKSFSLYSQLSQNRKGHCPS